jgi:hypothetical protein
MEQPRHIYASAADRRTGRRWRRRRRSFRLPAGALLCGATLVLIATELLRGAG